MEIYDVAIIGAGPAGAVLSRELGSTRRVLLADMRPMQAPVRKFGYKGPAAKFKGKCCGGLLAPDARRWLVDRKLILPASVLDEVQPDSLRAIDLASSMERVYPTSYINLSRDGFEKWLLSHVPETVDTLYSHRLKAVERVSDGFKLVFKPMQAAAEDAAAATVVHCRALVGADGANSTVRRFLKREIRFKASYLAVQDVFPVKGAKPVAGPELPEEYVALFHPSLTDFYGWIIPKSDRIVLGMALPPKVREAKYAAAHMDLLKEYLKQTGYDFSGSFRREGCLMLRPGLGDVYLGEAGVYLIGEAAGFISPSSAEGYSYAFISAVNLARAIIRHNTGIRTLRAYQFNSLKLYANITYKLSKSTIMYSPFLRQIIMHSGLLAKV